MEMILITSLHILMVTPQCIYIPGSRIFTKRFSLPQLEHDRHNTYQHGYVPSDNVVGIAVAVSSVPEQFSLKQNYPNPFNPQTATLFAVGSWHMLESARCSWKRNTNIIEQRNNASRKTRNAI